MDRAAAWNVNAMNDRLSVAELQQRWERALAATSKAVCAHPELYGKIKSTSEKIVGEPLDISQYFPMVEKLTGLLRTMDSCGGSIFHLFISRLSPTTIWQVRLLRLECKDLLAHLQAFEQWRRTSHRLRIVK
jgi:hypothetical protein